jgi:hypothetical protein
MLESVATGLPAVSPQSWPPQPRKSSRRALKFLKEFSQRSEDGHERRNCRSGELAQRTSANLCSPLQGFSVRVRLSFTSSVPSVWNLPSASHRVKNEPVVLTPKAFDTLLLLVRKSGHLQEKDELIGRSGPTLSSRRAIFRKGALACCKSPTSA